LESLAPPASDDECPNDGGYDQRHNRQPMVVEAAASEGFTCHNDYEGVGRYEYQS
jgi:hypothetical protein